MSTDAFGTQGLILPLLVVGGVQPEVTNSLADTARKLTATEAATKAMNNAWTETKAKVDLVAGAFRQLVGVVDQIAALTAEQDQLSAGAARLNLDFDRAAAGAGRFVDETEAMAAASRLAEAGIHLTQEELNQLTARAAIASQRLGVDTTTAFNMLTTAIESGSTRALRPFGADMMALAGEAHTADERLARLVETTRQMPRATDDATTSMAALRDMIGDAERTAASSFTQEMMRLHQISETTRGVTSDVGDQTHEMRAFGQTAALVVTGTLNGIALVLATAVNAVLAVVGVGRIALAELSSIAHGHLPGSAEYQREHAEAVRAVSGPGSMLRETTEFMSGRVDALSALGTANDPSSGNRAERRTAIADRNSMVFGDEYADADERARLAATHGAHPRGGGGARHMGRAQMARMADKAATNARFAADIEAENEAGKMAARDSVDTTDWVAKANAQREGAEASYAAQRATAAQSAVDPMAERRAQAATQREQRALDQRYQMQRSFTERWEELHSRQTSAAQHAAETISAAFETMGQAIGAHAQAVIEGRESVGEALQGILGDTLTSIGKQAVAKGGMEIAEGLAALAGGVTAGLAPGHFAAGAAFLAVGAAAGIAGGAISPSAPAGGGGAARAPAMLLEGGSRRGDSAGPITLVTNNYAPTFGGREGSNAEVGDRMSRFTRAADARLQRVRE